MGCRAPPPAYSPEAMASLGVAAAEPLRNRNFRVLWAASIVSNLGSFLQSVSASWLMLQLTGSATWVGLMVASTTLPLLAVAIPAGALADLVDRRRILLASQMIAAGAALAMSVLWSLGLITPGRLLALGLLLGTGFSIGLPAWQALVPDLVPRDQVAGAVALNSASFNVARAVGPALGGLLVATAGPGWGFGINAVSYLGVMAAIASFPRSELERDEPSLAVAVVSGLRFARFTPQLRWLLGLASAFAITTAVIQAALPSLTTEAFAAGAGVYGVLLGAMGVGALAGAFARPALAARLGRRLVPTGVLGFGLGGLIVGLAPVVAVAVLGMMLAGASWVTTLATLNATAQLIAPKWVRGRVMSLYTLAFMGVTPLGAVLGGTLADAFGVRAAMVGLSAVTVGLAFAATRLPIPALGDIHPPEPPTDYAPPEHPVAVDGGPVMVLTTYVIAEDQLQDFLDTMSALRLVRLRTGAYRWRLYRNVGDPHRMTEMMVLSSWEQHLRQHRRIDADGAHVMARARQFDAHASPVTHHLAAIDVVDPEERPDWDRLVAVHADYHAGEEAPHPARS